MGSPEPPPWFLIFLPRHFSNSWAPPGTSRISSWPSSHSSWLRLARHADAVLKHRWWLFHLGFYGEWTNLSLLKIGKSPTKWRHQVSLGDSKNAGYGLLQFMAIFWFETWWLNHEFLLSFFLRGPRMDHRKLPVLLFPNKFKTCDTILDMVSTCWNNSDEVKKGGAKTVPRFRPFSQMGIEAFLPFGHLMEFCWNAFGKTQLFEVPSCQIIDHNFYGFPNFSDSAIGDFLKLWRGMERDHARISNFSGRGRMLEFELLEHFASWKRLAIFGNSRRVLKVKGLISRLETHKIESGKGKFDVCQHSLGH